jgi:protein disulfide-isomerase
MRISALFLASLVSLAALQRGFAAAAWSTDLAKAQARAKAEGKAVLLNFTGSDWCGWCIKLRRDVFLKPDFEAYARTNLVLVEVDFPKRKPLAPETQKANQRLALHFQVQSYPTLILLDAKGAKLGAVNYANGGTKTFVAEVEKILRPPQEPTVARRPLQKPSKPVRYQPASAPLPPKRATSTAKPVAAREPRQSPRGAERN